LRPERQSAGHNPDPTRLNESMAETGNPARKRSLVLFLSALAIASASLSAILVVVDQRVAGFVAALGSGSALLLAGAKADDTQDARLRFADSLAERTVDAVILGTLAWVAFPEAPGVAAAALVALVASYLASYLRARAVGLGFVVEDALLVRPLRMTFVALGLLDHNAAQIALWAATAVSLQTIIVRAVSVARQKEPR
jgi:hypothetical protein